jgi:hypothetical protein
MEPKKPGKKKFNLERLEDRIAPSCFGVGGGSGHGSHHSGHGSKHC